LAVGGSADAVGSDGADGVGVCAGGIRGGGVAGDAAAIDWGGGHAVEAAGLSGDDQLWALCLSHSYKIVLCDVFGGGFCVVAEGEYAVLFFSADGD
jgi:hypothetical protein